MVGLLRHVAKVDPAFHAYLSLAVCTAARRSQLTVLRRSDVDLENGEIGSRVLLATVGAIPI